MGKYKVEITGINTSELKVLTQEEMTELFKKYKEGDKLAKDELVNGNLKLVLSILKRFNKEKYNLDDLLTQLREKSIKSIADVDYALLETSGKLSVFEKKDNNKDFPLAVILDGKIEEDVLKEINKNNKDS